jgi:hypothetical protein
MRIGALIDAAPRPYGRYPRMAWATTLAAAGFVAVGVLDTDSGPLGPLQLHASGTTVAAAIAAGYLGLPGGAI